MANGEAPRSGINWGLLISAATLLIALFTTMWSLIQNQISIQATRNDAAVESVRRELADLKDLIATQKESFRGDLTLLRADNSKLDSNKVDKDRFDRVLDALITRPEVQARDQALQKQIDGLESRLNTTQHDYVSKDDINARLETVHDRISTLFNLYGGKDIVPKKP